MRTQHPNIDEFIHRLKSEMSSKVHVTSHHVLPVRKSQFEALKAPFPDELEKLIDQEAPDGLYRHQTEALNRARDGENIVLSTPTASGKSLVYNLLLFERILNDPSASALYIFPLKALAQDQLRAFRSLAGKIQGGNPTAAIYDGDTSAHYRRKIRQAPPNVIMTNPEMIHLSLLPYHDRWERFLSRLRLVVVDELHVYRGLWGAHMAQVIRRLQRICRFYGTAPRFVCCSATVGNPETLAGQIIGEPVATIQRGGAPSGRKHFLCADPFDGSTVSASVELLQLALDLNVRTIVYTRSRRLAEWITIKAGGRNQDASARISAYRAGFTPEERRRIESQLASGKLTAVVSTSALELGIDVGDLDLCILVGFPGSVMATFQRSGRVGRRGNDSAVIFLAGEDALDRYYLKHPERLVFGTPESAVINPDNLNILNAHLPCAAAELPLSASEAAMNLASVKGAAETLVAESELLAGHDGRSWYAKRKFPQRLVSLRGMGDRYRIVVGTADAETILGEIDGYRACKETHPGAIYLHRSESYRVTALDFTQRTVRVEPLTPDYYTKVQSREDTEIINLSGSRKLGACRICCGRIRVTEQVTGYEIWQIRPHRRREIRPLNLPPMTYETEGMWMVFSDRLLQGVSGSRGEIMGGLHAFEHAAIGISPLIVLCDRDDIGGVSTTYHPQLAAAGIFVFDGLPGGAGISRELYTQAERLLESTYTVIKECPCDTGCPACIHSPKCGSGNRPMDKHAAMGILEAVMADGRFADQPKKHPNRSCIDRGDGEQGGGGWNGSEKRREPAAGKGSGEQPAAKAGDLPEAPDGKIRYLVFDLETQRSAAEVGGWHRADRMGISCAVAYDFGEGRYFEYREEDVPRLIHHMKQAELVIGFNSKRFDYQVLSGYDGFDFWGLPTLDLLEQVHMELGFRLSLNHLAKETLGAEKSGDGLQALRWWKQGRINELLAYCRKDVEITRSLYLHGRKKGFLLFRSKLGHRLRVPVRW